jgi:hypothetical protein
MTIPLQMNDWAEAEPARGAILRECLPPAAEPNSRGRLELSTAELALRIFAALRSHPHINNVLTHISRANWGEVAQSLNRILDPSATGDGLSALEENIIELMVGERGITGRILKPYFQSALHRLLEPSRAERLIRNINALHLELESKVQQAALVPIEASEEADDAGSRPK